MKTLLIVEDEKAIRKGICAMVQRAPVEVETILECRGGLEALSILQDRPVDVMITDIRMPQMDGIELVERARTLPDPPVIIAISGHSDFSYAVEMLRKGVRDYLLKPVERDKLHALLKELDGELARRDMEQQHSHVTGKHLLRAWVLGGLSGPVEQAALEKQFESRFFTEPYAVLCVPTASRLEEDPDSLLVLEDMRGHTALLAHKDRLPALRQSLALYSPGISRLHTGLAALRTAFAQAEAARSTAFVQGRSTEFAAGDTLPLAAAQCTRPEELEQLVYLLGNTEDEAAGRLFEAMRQELAGGTLAPRDFAACMAGLPALVRSAYGAELPSSLAPEALGNIWAWPSLSAYAGEMQDWMEAFGRYLQEAYGDQNKRKIMGAILYMQQHFRQEIDMAMVSNHVSMNYTQFSLLFKQHTGQNFIDYLKNLRLEESKRLLRETSLRVWEISEKAGFKNEKHFMKIFKQNTAVSPTEYRRIQEMAEPKN